MNKKKILILSPYPKNVAPSQRLKYEQYFDIWEQNGFKLHIFSFVSYKFWDVLYLRGKWLAKIYYSIKGYIERLKILCYISYYDLIYIHLWVTPFGLPFFEWITVKLAKKVIYDIDDMVFLGHSSNANRFIKSFKGRKKMIFLMKHADHVITCTPALDKFVRQYNPKTTDISSTINTDIYIPKKNYKITPPVILGWSGSHSTSKYLKLLEPVFEKLLENSINFKVLCIGDKNFKFSNQQIPLEAVPWKLETEVNDLSRIDIGLYPLPDEPWVYGKSGLKALQYMGLGIPTIATAVGTNFRIITDGQNGFLVPVDNIDIWIQRIIELIESPELRKKIGQAGRKTVEKYYSVEANKEKYLNILNTLTSR